ncbi:radical SAM protein [Dehalobacter sp. DCM]|uniref:radical SAM/SPASM domain-containing protein n=1 Tax=Dehalobacter sp. DCM TaxID=2907827 RepID=UPI0030814163|nr:radical SAM protein [Dehalobacter sp. DCM]
MKKERTLIVLWTTSKCNLQCQYCYASAAGEQKDMAWETAVKILDYFADQPVKLQLTGGEPLLNYDLICKLYEYIVQRGYDISLQLQTNGTLINQEIAKGIKKMKMAVGVSLDGPPAANESLRGGTQQTVQGIQHLAKAGVMLNVNSVVTAQNVEKLPELADFALYLGNVAGIGFDLLRKAGRAKESSGAVRRPTGEQLNSALRRLYERSESIYRQFGRKIMIREVEEAKKRLCSPACSQEYCYASCGRSYVFLPNGDCYPCGSLIDAPDYYMGNIWNPSLKPIALAKQRAGQCEACSYQAFCPGGCPSRLIINADEMDDTLDCVLKKSAFNIASNL